MAIPAPEYREQLLAQGCEEGLADAVLSLVEAARDDAEAAVIMKVSERIARSEQQLNGRLDEHAEQFHGLESAIHESAAETTRTLTALIKQQTAETNQQVAETNQRVALVEQQVADLKLSVTEQLGDLKLWVAEQIGEMKIQIAEQEVKSEQRFGRLQGRLLQFAIGISGLIIGAAAAIIAAIAVLG